MPRTAVTAPGAVAIGPYSHAVWAGDLLYLSGQTPAGPGGTPAGADAGEQARQCLANLFAVLTAAGLGPDDVVKANVYLVDMADFERMNAAYGAAFSEPYPARTTVAVSALPRGARVEIELVARSAASSARP